MSDFKFEVGQQFRVLKAASAGLSAHYENGDIFEVVDIDVDHDGVDKNDLYINAYDIEQGCVELIKEPTKAEFPKGFSKSDLCDGMITESRDGHRFMAMPSRGDFLSVNEHDGLHFYNEDLTNCHSKSLDIMKVWNLSDFTLSFENLLKSPLPDEDLVFDRVQEFKNRDDLNRLESLEKEIAELKEKIYGE